MHAAQEVQVTWVAADGVEPRVHSQKDCPVRVVLISHFQVFPGLITLFEGLKESDQTWKYLEMAYEDHSYWTVFLRVDPRFDAIRGDPRYLDLLRRMHLTP